MQIDSAGGEGFIEVTKATVCKELRRSIRNSREWLRVNVWDQGKGWTSAHRSRFPSKENAGYFRRSVRGWRQRMEHDYTDRPYYY